ncbi:hypothetical protein GCM10022419_046210 [Nonomuraea rosea]|uniref:Uncharacterized protein n=1 Tax=Nonomuraea rosea TaxID=638574 RepID=A0ABP6X4P1_9ACTN
MRRLSGCLTVKAKVQDVPGAGFLIMERTPAGALFYHGVRRGKDGTIRSTFTVGEPKNEDEEFDIALVRGPKQVVEWVGQYLEAAHPHPFMTQLDNFTMERNAGAVCK